MMRAILPLVLLCSLVHGQTQTTPIPANFTVQPTDLLSIANNYPSSSGLTIVPLATQGFAVEYTGPVTQPLNTQLNIPCSATANPQAIEYSWFKWNPTTKQWTGLTNSGSVRWSALVNGDPANAGMLILQPYDKTANAGAYMCRAKTDYATAVSEVLNLTAASFPNEGVQASVTQRSVPAGTYTKLDVPQSATIPAANASWTRTTSKDVPSGSGNEIPPDRTQMDEKGAMHIGYLDNSLLQVMGVSGTSNYNFYHFKYMSLRYVITDLAIFQLSVTGSVPPTVSCNLQYQTPSLNLVHGQSSRIACVYSGSPAIRVSYFKQDTSGKLQQLTTQVVAGGDAAQALLQTGLYGNTYMIGSAQTTDAGTYSCSATFATDGQNVCGGTTTPIKVTVDLEPTFVSQPNPITYVVEGQSVTLQWRVKGRPKPTIEIGQNAITQLPSDPNKIQSSEQDSIVDPVDGLPVYSRTFTLFKAIKPSDSRSVQVYATNQYYMAVSSIALTVISPISFPAKMGDQLAIAVGAKATFICTAYADDALVPTITWTRFFGGVTYPVTDTGPGGQYSIATNDASSPSGLRALSQTLTVDTSVVADKDGSRGQYACNVSNGVTWSVTSARLSFVGEDPVAAASFEMWMLGPILGGVAAIVLVIGIIFAVRRNRGEKYEVEDEEIKKGYDPKKEAHEQRELREYQRDREKDAEPLRQSQNAGDIERDDEA